ncbi:MAG: phospholipase effector Tle1 domain-containing protein, partial [Aestuariivirgaceae bacterium]
MYNLVFSDGTGQRGVRKDGSSTNVHKLFVAARRVDAQTCFYDAGVGADPEKSQGIGRWFSNLAAKATGLGITKNIRDCYDFLLRAQQPDRPIGLFGFSRGAYTVRSVGGVLTLCGIPAANQGSIDLTVENDPGSIAKRAELVKEAVEIYQRKSGGDGAQSREQMAARYRERYRCADANLKVIGAFDTVAALGLPGVMNIFNPLKHSFHDQFLSEKVPFGFQALSIDENREVFKPVLWEEVPAGVQQVINQQWFPGVHSDV